VPRIALLVLALLSALGGCGDDALQEADSGEAPAPPREAPGVITDADAGASFALSPGSETTLRLSGDYLWSEPLASGGAVQLVRVDYFQDPGFSEWVVQAVRPGTATVAAAGRPACAGEDGCPDEPARFEVTITVAH
jgi:predicted secreted protein